jgi:hypothetical protein
MVNKTYILATPLDRGVGISYCGSYDEIVPEPYQEQKECKNCSSVFEDIKVNIGGNLVSLEVYLNAPSVKELLGNSKVE